MKVWEIAAQWLPAVAIGVVLIGYDQLVRPHPEIPASPLVAAAKTYVKTLPEAYSSASAQVKNGVLSDKKAVITALQAHAKPLAEALDNAFNPIVDSQQHIINAPAAAETLSQVANAIKGEVK